MSNTLSHSVQSMGFTPSNIKIEEVKNKISIFKGIEEVPESYANSIDYIVLHGVLEHVYDLNSFYKNVNRLLSNDGISYNFVVLSDHTYHIFTRFRVTHNICNRRALFHLRYSNKIFSKLNDDRSFMNRVLLPIHCELANKNKLTFKIFEKANVDKAPIHKDLINCISGEYNRDDLYVASFHISLKKLVV